MAHRLPAIIILVAATASPLAAAQTPQPPDKPPAAEPAPRQPVPVSIPVAFKKGDKVELVMTISKEKRSKPGAPPTRGSSTTDVTVEVLDIDENNNARIAWTLGEIELPTLAGEKGSGAAAARAVAEITRGIRLEFIVDSDGAIAELVNWKDVVARVNRAIDTIMTELSKQGKDEEAVAAARRVVEQMYADRDTAEGMLLKDPAIYFEAFGYDLEDDQEQVFEDELPNLFGGPPLPAEVTLSFPGHDPAAPTVEIHLVQRCTEEAKAALIETVKQLATTVGKPMPDEAQAELEAANVSIEMEYHYVYDKARRWVRDAKFTHRVVIGEMHQTETRTFRLKDPPKPSVTP